MKSYKRYLLETLKMNDADADLFLSDFELFKYDKGDFLLKEGDNSNTIRVILEGCARGFVVNDGKEITTNFYFEYDHIYDYVSYMKQERAQMNIQALDSLSVIEFKCDMLDFYNSENLGIHRMSFQMFKMNIIKSESQRHDFIIKSPKQRYFDLLMNNKQIISRVPQHQVASFIGISAEHLSRIRKEIRDSRL